MGNKFILIHPNMPKQTKGKKTVERTRNTSGLFENRPKNLRIGGAIQPKRDLTRFVRWPRYILAQRQKRVLYQRLRVPPAINQFTKTLTANQSKNLWRLLSKYAPETKKDKVTRLKAAAELKATGKEVQTQKPHTVKFGVNHVTQLVENGQAKLVIIAHDVDPIELVVWLPQLCRNKNVPFVVVKDKARLGKIVHQSTASCCAFTTVKKEDTNDLENCCRIGRSEYLEKDSLRTTYATPVMGVKARHKMERLERAKNLELMKKA